MKKTEQRRHLMAAVSIGAAAVLTLSACGGSPDGGTEPSTDTRSALEEGGSITVWAWEPTLEPVAEQFMAEYPNVEVTINNVGTGEDQYTALENAMQAGSGLPDVAQVEYYAIPQFALSEGLTDLNSFGASEYDGSFSTGPWNAVQADGGIYGLPMDSGPMAMFYNEKVFEEHDVEVPETWEEYLEAARQLKEADPDISIANDLGDAGFTTSMIWQAGGHPFTVDGNSVGVNLADEGTQRYAQLWQQLLDEDLLAPVSSWSDEWYAGLGDGSIATLTSGAWMPANFESGVADGAGDWRVAPMPQWEAGGQVSAENGGSSLAVPADAPNAALAYEFIRYANAGEGVQTRIDGGAFPATTEHLTSEEFQSYESEYFGGQKINEVLSASAEQVAPDWQYLPYQVYANSVFNDTVGQAYGGGTTLTDGLAQWQETLITFGRDQGFEITS